jgi:hypothetical protein
MAPHHWERSSWHSVRVHLMPPDATQSHDTYLACGKVSQGVTTPFPMVEPPCGRLCGTGTAMAYKSGNSWSAWQQGATPNMCDSPWIQSANHSTVLAWLIQIWHDSATPFPFMVILGRYSFSINRPEYSREFPSFGLSGFPLRHLDCEAPPFGFSLYTVWPHLSITLTHSVARCQRLQMASWLLVLKMSGIKLQSRSCW